MGTTVYKNVNDIQKFLAGILATFPSIYLADKTGNGIDLNTMLLNPVMQQSKDFCADLENGKILFTPYDDDENTGGLIIAAGTTTSDVMLNHISIGPKRKKTPMYTVYHLPITVRRSPEPEPYTAELLDFRGRLMFSTNEDLHQAVIASLMSHMYDVGICPGALKCFGNYACLASDDEPEAIDLPVPTITKQYISYLVTEKTSYSLFDVIRTQKHEDVFLKMNVHDIENITTQLAHTLYVMRHSFGIIPFDLNLKNVLLSHIKKGGDVLSTNDETFIQEYYGAQDLKMNDYFCYEIPSTRNNRTSRQILVANNGFLVKVGDTRMCTAEFDMNDKGKRYGFPLSTKTVRNTYWLREAIENQKNYATVSINFFLYNLMGSLYRTARGMEGIDPETGVNLPPRSQEIRDHASKLAGEVKEFVMTVNPSFSFEKVGTSLRKDTSVRYNTSQSVRNFVDVGDIVELRDVGEPTPATEGDDVVLKRIWDYLYSQKKEHAQSTVYITRTGERSIIHEDTNVLYIPYATGTQRAKENNVANKFTPMERFMDRLYKYNSMCLDKKGNEMGSMLSLKERKDVCSGMELEISTWDPRRRDAKSWNRDNVTNTSIIFDNHTGGIRKGITTGILNQAGLMRTQIDRRLSHFYLEIYPKLFATRSESNFRLEAHQRFHNGSYLKEKVGEFMERVNVHLMYYTNKDLDVLVDAGGNPMKASAKVLGGSGGAVFGGGTCITEANKNTTTPEISDKDMHKPLGFFYTRKDLKKTGTPIPVPSGYRKDWGVVVLINNQFAFYTYDDFEALHETQRVPCTLFVEKDSGVMRWETSETTIKVKHGRPVMKQKLGGIPYDAAVSLGPILVWDGNVVFSRHKMLRSMFTVDLFRHNPVEEQTMTIRNDEAEDEVLHGDLYRLHEDAETPSMYFTTEHEESSNPYGARDANLVTGQTALCQTFDGKMLYISVEGDLSSPGLDKSQFASLISHFNVRYAVSLSSGQHTSAVYRERADEIKWLEARPYTTSKSVLFAIRH